MGIKVYISQISASNEVSDLTYRYYTTTRRDKLTCCFLKFLNFVFQCIDQKKTAKGSDDHGFTQYKI